MSLKARTVADVRGGIATRNSLTASLSLGIAGAMLLEMSIATTRSSGASSAVKLEIDWADLDNLVLDGQSRVEAALVVF